jgi:deoxyadenosine/deoxycytidine kinase
MNTNICVVSIEGNIGSGKSTLLANLKKHFNNNNESIVFLQEPVDEWTKIVDENGTNIIEKFYSDQNKYSFSFQMMAYISRLKLLKDAFKQLETLQKIAIKNKSQQMLLNYNEEEDYFNIPKYVIVTERSLFTDKLVFAKMLYDSGKIEHINYQIYLNWFNTFVEEFPVNKIVYVNTDHEICHQRINKRHRNGEDAIPLDYLKSCNEYHTNMLDRNSPDCVCKDQLVLNGNCDIFENDSILKNWIASIEKFIM